MASFHHCPNGSHITACMQTQTEHLLLNPLQSVCRAPSSMIFCLSKALNVFIQSPLLSAFIINGPQQDENTYIHTHTHTRIHTQGRQDQHIIGSYFTTDIQSNTQNLNGKTFMWEKGLMEDKIDVSIVCICSVYEIDPRAVHTQMWFTSKQKHNLELLN